MSKAVATTTTTTTTTTASSKNSSLDLPASLMKDLLATTIARGVRQEMRQTAYFGKRDLSRKRKAEEATERNDKKKFRRNGEGTSSTTPSTPSSSVDVTMVDVAALKEPVASSSNTQAPGSGV
jgi:hypothetical protein